MSSASQPQQLVSSNFINLIAYHAQEQATQPKQLCTTLTSQAARERAQLQEQTPSQHLREHLRRQFRPAAQRRAHLLCRPRGQTSCWQCRHCRATYDRGAHPSRAVPHAHWLHLAPRPLQTSCSRRCRLWQRRSRCHQKISCCRGSCRSEGCFDQRPAARGCLSATAFPLPSVPPPPPPRAARRRSSGGGCAFQRSAGCLVQLVVVHP